MMFIHYFIFLAVVYHVTPVQSSVREHNNLSCFATLSPYDKVICPQDRLNFCVKEYTNSSRKECGTSSQHPFDQWDVKEPGGLCVYRKCADSCPNQTKTFIGRNGEVNSRSSACCASSLCNQASSHRRSPLVIWFAQCVMVYVFFGM